MGGRQAGPVARPVRIHQPGHRYPGGAGGFARLAAQAAIQVAAQASAVCQLALVQALDQGHPPPGRVAFVGGQTVSGANRQA